MEYFLKYKKCLKWKEKSDKSILLPLQWHQYDTKILTTIGKFDVIIY
jgi:hypothetical protein